VLVRGTVLIALAASASGCFPIALGSTTHEQNNRTQIDTRVSSRQADVSGEKCYVENKNRVTSTVYVLRGRSGIVRGVAGVEVVGSGLAAALTPAPNQIYWLIPIADGVLAWAYMLLRDDSISSSDDWEPSTDTAPCRK
jgi:hypothetical protein